MLKISHRRPGKKWVWLRKASRGYIPLGLMQLFLTQGLSAVHGCDHQQQYHQVLTLRATGKKHIIVHIVITAHNLQFFKNENYHSLKTHQVISSSKSSVTFSPLPKRIWRIQNQIFLSITSHHLHPITDFATSYTCPLAILQGLNFQM